MTVMANRPGLAIARSAFTGVAAGVAAAYAMTLFQQLWSPAAIKNSTAEPATAKAADGVAIALTGKPVPAEHRKLAANVAHYGLGATLGVVYFAGARYRPAITAGTGSAFGIAVAMTLDNALVPALRLGSAPWKTPPRSWSTGWCRTSSSVASSKLRDVRQDDRSETNALI